MQHLISLLNAIPNLIIIGILIKLVSKEATPEAVLMLVGSSLGVCLSIFYAVGLPLLAERNGYQHIQSYVGLTSIIGFVGYLLFAIGLVLFIQKVLSKQ